MARPIWTGSLSFGLVNVPVALYSAAEDKTVHFHQFQAGTSDRIRYKRVNERTGREVGLASIVRGSEVGDGEYVLINDEELEAVEPGRSRTIDITDFVALDEIDPIYFQRTYYLAPRGEGAERAYGLLHQAMAATGKAGIATFVMRGKQYLVAVRPREDVLALETMYFADEIRDPREEIDSLPSGRTFSDRELTVARQLIDSMTTPWRPGNYRDTYRERVADLIERKRRGEEIVTQGAPPESAAVVDLMEALRRSAEAARGRRGGGGGRRGDASGDLSQMTKSELTGLAGLLDIAGRSKMDRNELADAIRKAKGRSRRKTAS